MLRVNRSLLNGSQTKLLLRGDALTDASPSGRTVTNNNGVSVVSSTGPPGNKALSFNGSNQYLSVAQSTDFLKTQDLTIHFWAEPSVLQNSGAVGTNVATGGIIIGREAATTGNYWGVWASSNDSTWDIALGNNFGSAAPYTTGAKQHIALVLSGNKMLFFKDGIKAATEITMSARPSNTYGHLIGAAWGVYFAGKLQGVTWVRGALWTKNFIPPARY